MRFVGISILLVAGCEQEDVDRPASLLTPCYVSGLDAESLCGTVTVFEDRAAGTGREIALRVLVIPAISPYPRPDPLFFLAGGPGQAASEVASTILPALSQVQRRRDLVFVDQRGTGRSNGLRCRSNQNLSLQAQLALDPMAELQRCREHLSDQADLTLYTTDLAVADLEDVRQALGYGPVNLYGVSYGTRVAQEYVRRHPASVRSIILDGVVPPQMPVGLHFAADGQAALDALFSDCEADPACSAAFPTFRQDFDATIQQLSGPEPLTVTITHPRTGQQEEIPMERDTFTGGIQGMLYVPTLLSLAPLTLQAAHAGDFSPFVTQTLGMNEGLGESIAQGMQISVMCAEDATRYPADAVSYAEGTMLGPAALDELRESCARWPAADHPAGLDEPLESDVPALLLSGALDPVTPPRWGDAAAETLPASLHLVAPGAGHNVGPYGCVPRLMAEFIEAGSVDGLETDCVADIQRPPFFIDFAGPSQ